MRDNITFVTYDIYRALLKEGYYYAINIVPRLYRTYHRATSRTSYLNNEHTTISDMQRIKILF